MASSDHSTLWVLCERAARQRAGRRSGRRPGAARSATLHSAPCRRRWRSKIQQRIYQGERISRLENAWRPHAHQFTMAQSTAARHTETARECGGVHCAGAADRFHNGGGGVLAVGQLLVAGAGGHPGGRLTRDGGRLHARVAPASCGDGNRPRLGGVVVACAAAAAAAARAHVAARCLAPLPRHRRRLPKPAKPATAPLLTRLCRALLPSA